MIKNVNILVKGTTILVTKIGKILKKNFYSMKHNNDTYFKTNKLVGIKDSNPKDIKCGEQWNVSCLNIIMCFHIYARISDGK